jgi:hypothetical protein
MLVEGGCGQRRHAPVGLLSKERLLILVVVAVAVAIYMTIIGTVAKCCVLWVVFCKVCVISTAEMFVQMYRRDPFCIPERQHLHSEAKRRIRKQFSQRVDVIIPPWMSWSFHNVLIFKSIF